MRIMIGRNILTEYGQKLSTLLRTEEDCESSPECSEILERILAMQHTTKHGDPLGLLELIRRLIFETEAHHLCELCLEANRERLEGFLEIIWNQLPFTFSILKVRTCGFLVQVLDILLTAY